MKKVAKDKAVRRVADALWESRIRRKGELEESRIGYAINMEGREVELGREWCERNVNKYSKMNGARSTKASKGGKTRKKEKNKAISYHRKSNRKLVEMEGKRTRVRNRCVLTGNGRNVIGWYRISGRCVRERARGGKLDGVYRVSW